MSGHRARARRRQLAFERARRRGWKVLPDRIARQVPGSGVVAYQLALPPEQNRWVDYLWSRSAGKPQAARASSWGSRLRWVLSVAWTPWEAVVFVLVGVAIGAAGWGLHGAMIAAGFAVVLWGAALVAALSCYQKD